MNGSTPYRIVHTDKFGRTFANLIKHRYKKDPKNESAFKDLLAEVIKKLSAVPDPPRSRQEPWPHGTNDPDWEFRKLEIDLPGHRGAAREGRLMYLANEAERAILLVWIYTHADFAGRPPERDLGSLLRELTKSIEPKGAK